MVWLVVVSITNLGFGDIVPNSVGGRVFVGLASILGVAGYQYIFLLQFLKRHKQLTRHKHTLDCTYDWGNARLAKCTGERKAYFVSYKATT